MERQRKFVGLQKWGLRYIMGSVPVLLQLALLLFNGGLIVYLWDLDRSSADVMLAVTCTGFAFYTVITAIATICDDGSPFQTTLSALLLSAWPLVKKITTRPKRLAAPPPRTEPAEEHAHPTAPTRHLPQTSSSGGAAASIHDDDYMKLSNPVFWRTKPLFDPLPMDTSASAGFWLIENSTDFSAAAAVATVFYEFQWPSHHHSPTALIRLRDTYVGRFRAHRVNKLARLQALQCAAAYYVLYHAWLIWIKAKGREAEVEKLLPTLPLDLLLLHNNSEEWRGRDLFEYLLRIENRSEHVESPQFLSYIAPYWFCGDSDAAIRFRSGRLETLSELIAVLKSFKALVPATLTDCVLCVGAVMDFPLHPDDLIRVDKRCVLLLDMLRVVLIRDSDYLAPTFKLVVEHVLGTALAGSRRYRHVAEALKILLTLVKLTTLPLVNATWIHELLKRAASSKISDEEFTLVLKLSAWRKEEGAAVNTGVGDPPVQHFEADPQSLEKTATSEAPTSDDTLFRKVMEAIQTCSWQDEIVYGGLLAIRDVRQLGPSLFDDEILQTFHEATDDSKHLRVRQAAYDAVLVTQAQWLTSENLRQKLQDLGFFDHLHKVVVEIARSDYQRSFLTMMEVLSEDVNWHQYLREHMELWVPFRYEGAPQILHIIGKVGGLTLATPGDRGSPPIDDLLQRLMVKEWAAVPGRPLGGLTADRLKPLVKVTEGLKEVVFDDSCRSTVIATVEQVIPGLERRIYDGYEGPGKDVRDIIRDLLENLRLPFTRRSHHD